MEVVFEGATIEKVCGLFLAAAGGLKGRAVSDACVDLIIDLPIAFDAVPAGDGSDL